MAGRGFRGIVDASHLVGAADPGPGCLVPFLPLVCKKMLAGDLVVI